MIYDEGLIGSRISLNMPGNNLLIRVRESVLNQAGPLIGSRTSRHMYARPQCPMEATPGGLDLPEQISGSTTLNTMVSWTHKSRRELHSPRTCSSSWQRKSIRGLLNS